MISLINCRPAICTLFICHNFKDFFKFHIFKFQLKIESFRKSYNSLYVIKYLLSLILIHLYYDLN